MVVGAAVTGGAVVVGAAMTGGAVVVGAAVTGGAVTGGVVVVGAAVTGGGVVAGALGVVGASTVLLIGVLLFGVNGSSEPTSGAAVASDGSTTAGVVLAVVLVVVLGAGVVGAAWGAACVSAVLLHETLRQPSPNATALTVTGLLSVGRKRFSLRAGVVSVSIGVLQGKAVRGR